MARMRFTAHTGGEVALVAATAKTVLHILAPTNQRIACRGYALSFDGVAGNAEPVIVELLRVSTAGTMAAGSAVKDDALGSETLQTSVTKTATVEPTAGDILRQDNIHPQTGVEFRFAPDEEVIVPGAGRLAIRCTAPAAVNVLARMLCEE